MVQYAKLNYQSTEQDLVKDVADCKRILNDMNPCREISIPIAAVLDAKERELSFKRVGLPRLQDIDAHDTYEQIKNEFNSNFRDYDMQTYTDKAPLWVAKFIDYLGEPRFHFKSYGSIAFYETVILHLNGNWQNWPNENKMKFFDDLEGYVSRLNEEKYKLDAVPGESRGLTFSKGDLQDLQEYFKEHQKIMADANGTSVGAQTYYMTNRDRMINLHNRTSAFTSDLGTRMRESDSPNDVASFVFKIGEEKLIRFFNDIMPIFDGKAKMSNKFNLPRISQKITELCQDQNIEPSEAWARIGDILRLQIFCASTEEVKEVFRKKIMPEGTMMQVVRIKPRFTSFLQDCIINFNWMNICICELQIKLGNGKLSRGYEEQHFIYEVLRVLKDRSVGTLAEAFDKRKNQLVGQNRISSANFSHSMDTRPKSLQDAVNKAGGDHRNYTR